MKVEVVSLFTYIRHTHHFSFLYILLESHLLSRFPTYPHPEYTYTMNRSLRILKPQTYALPYRPRPTGLPSNLLRPAAPTSIPAGAKVSQYLTFMRTYATGPSQGAGHDDKYIEKQKATPGAKEEVSFVPSPRFASPNVLTVRASLKD